MTASKKLQVSAIAVLFSLLFAAIDWQSLSGAPFVDLLNYKIGFDSGYYMFTVINLKGLDFILSESAWIYGFDYLTSLTGDIYESFYIVSVASLALCSLYVMQRTKKAYYLIFLCNPIFIDLTIGQIRSALATGIFYSALTLKSPVWKAALFVIAISFHTSFIVFAGIYVLFHAKSRTFVRHLVSSRPALNITAVAATCFLIIYLQDAFLLAIDDRRADVYTGEVSGWLFAGAWLSFVCSYYVLLPRKAVSFEYYLFSFCIFLLTFSNFFSTYGSRFAAISVPALVVMSSQLPPRSRALFLAQYVLFVAAYFSFWLG